jgi:hypothetical protein
MSREKLSKSYRIVEPGSSCAMALARHASHGIISINSQAVARFGDGYDVAEFVRWVTAVGRRGSQVSMSDAGSLQVRPRDYESGVSQSPMQKTAAKRTERETVRHDFTVGLCPVSGQDQVTSRAT